MSAAAAEDPEKLAKKAAKEAEKAAKLASERKSRHDVTRLDDSLLHRTQSERREERRVGCGESGALWARTRRICGGVDD
jgi:hypothetical protein